MTETPSVTRRTFLRLAWRAGAGVAITSASSSLYAAWLEPQWLAVERVDVSLPRLPAAFDGFRIALLSDFHRDSTPVDVIASAVETANQLEPDLTLLAGDYVTRDRGNVADCAREISRLNASQGVFGVLGNHDWRVSPSAIASTLRRQGVEVLSNQSLALARGGARLWLIGAEDARARRADLDVALAGVPEGEAKVLLVHEPDFADQAAGYSIDLQLSGHSHGGQVRLPGIGALFLPRMGRKYPIGLRRVGSLQVYTTRGVGMVQPAVRLNCRPEVTLVTLRARG